jgi:beta-lactamase regulating signal transducer with metallopeptidase domain
MSWLPLQTVAQISVERILNALPEGFLVALFAWALLRVLRRQNSGTRFAVWFLALLTVAALPMFGIFGPGRAAPTSPAGWGSVHPAITIPSRWALFAFIAWALGMCLAMLRLAVGLWRLRQLRRSCTAIAAADFDPGVRKMADVIRASGTVAIASSECVRVPAAIGLFNRTIVLPDWALHEMPPEDLNVVLLHEFAHLRRGDDWTNLIQKIVRALFFFHPAVWWIESRLSVEREMACDDAVLAETSNPNGYARCLVSLLEKSLAHRLAHPPRADKRWSMAQAAVHRAREAALRLAQILDTNRPVATRVWKPALAMVGVFSVVCLAALPHTPQLVAFDRGVVARDSAHEYSAAVSQPAPQSLSSATSTTGGPGVPARLNPSSALRADGRDARRSIPRPHEVAHRANSAPRPEQLVAVSARADQGIVPQFQTLVLIEATQYVASDSSVWRVQVWRLTLLNTVRDRTMGVPVANSI